MKEYFTNLQSNGVTYDVYDVGLTPYVNGVRQRKLEVYASNHRHSRSLYVVEVPVLIGDADIPRFSFFTASSRKSDAIAMKFCTSRHSYDFLLNQTRKYVSSLLTAVNLVFSFSYNEYMLRKC